MIVKEVMRSDDPLFDAFDRRVRIEADDSVFWPPDEWDHSFMLWSNVRCIRSDRLAYNPFRENEDGEWEADDGLIVFSVSMYEHSLRHFSLGSKGFACDPKGWDTTRGAFYLYTDPCLWENMHGKGTWHGKGDAEFMKQVRKEAEGYVKELNLAESGQLWGYVAEHKEKWTKTFADGRQEEGFDWVEDDSCWGFLTDEVEDIDFPRAPDVPVFSARFDGCEYRIPEYVVTKKAADGVDMYLMEKDDDGYEGWCATVRDARVFTDWSTANTVAREYIRSSEYDPQRNIVEKDGV